MLTHIRSYYNEGLLTCVEDIPSFLDFFDEHGSEYPRYWRLLLRWLSFQDVDDVINRFNQAMMLRGEEVEDPAGEAEDRGEEDARPDREEVLSKSARPKS
eukprot:2450310-Amphidinium_carterae.1